MYLTYLTLPALSSIIIGSDDFSSEDLRAQTPDDDKRQ